MRLWSVRPKFRTGTMNDDRNTGTRSVELERLGIKGVLNQNKKG